MRAGPLTCELRGAKLCHIRCGEREVWHGASFLFRDADWGTPELVVDRIDRVDGVGTADGESWFRLEIAGHFATEPVIDFTLRIEGGGGRIAFEGVAVPRGDIQASRLGLCVTHPMDVCGAAIEVEHVDGRVSRSTFPTLIPPWPPFMLIRAIRHEYAPGCMARCAFEGDAFELEDQRNNSDPSFKTYSRSNLMPRPYWLRGGVAVRQSVELRLDMPGPGVPRRNGRHGRNGRDAGVHVQVGAECGAMPGVGIEIAPSDLDAARPGSALAAALSALHPSHLHLAIDAASPVDWPGVARLLVMSNATLCLDVNVDHAHVEALDALGGAMREAGIVAPRIAVFPSEQRCLDAARRALPGSAIGGGTPHFFVQLNRIERLGDVDFLSFTTSPIVHAADDETVMLTLASLPSMIETLRAQHPDARFAVGPSIIGARRSPLGKQPETDGLHRVPLARNDPRCRGLLGAAWVLGYVAQMAAAGVDAVTLMSLTGTTGVIRDVAGNRQAVTPAYRVIQCLERSVPIREVTISDPGRLAALALDRDDGPELLLANLTSEPVDVTIEGWGTASSCAVLDAKACAAMLDAGNSPDFRSAAIGGKGEPWLRLDAYAIARIA